MYIVLLLIFLSKVTHGSKIKRYKNIVLKLSLTANPQVPSSLSLEISNVISYDRKEFDNICYYINKQINKHICAYF